MTKCILLGLVVFPVGLVAGWLINFINWYYEKRSLRWARLLCKPFPLTEEQDAELVSFYERET